MLRTRLLRMNGGARCGALLEGGGAGCLLQIADKRVFEAGGAAGLDQFRRGSGRQHPAGIHQRYAVAAFGLVHEMGRDENRHTLVARKIDQRFPEAVPRQRIDA